MVKPKKAQAPDEGIGSRLKKAREEKGISLEEAHRQTKMHPNVLQALEEDKLEHVLGKTYVKAFLKKYANYLGLDDKAIVREYDTAHAAEAKEGPVLKQEPLTQEKKRPNNTTIIRVASVILVAVIGFTIIRSVTRDKGTARDQEAATVPQTKESIEAEKETAGKGFIPVPRSRTIKLTVTTDKEVWLKVTRDGELTFHGILPKNSKETWQAGKEIKLSEIGRPEALSLNVNGKNIDTSGRRLGKNIVITHEGVDIGSK